jgi:hypothetical protein
VLSEPGGATPFLQSWIHVFVDKHGEGEADTLKLKLCTTAKNAYSYSSLDVEVLIFLQRGQKIGFSRVDSGTHLLWIFRAGKPQEACIC